MRYSLRTLFLDLVAFVPHGNQMIAVTPKPRENDPGHSAALIYDQNNFVDGDPGETLRNSSYLKVWWLDTEDVTIVNPHPDVPDEVDQGPPVGNDELPSGYSRRFQWVTPIPELQSAHNGRVANSVISGPSDLVSSRMIIPKGRMRSEHFSSYQPSEDVRSIYRYKFETGSKVSPIRTRALVNLTSARIPIKDEDNGSPGATIHLKASSFDGRPTRRLELSTGGAASVDIVFANLATSVHGSLSHFELFYRLMHPQWSPDFWYEASRLPTTRVSDSLVNPPLPPIIAGLQEPDTDLKVDPEACPQCRFGG